VIFASEKGFRDSERVRKFILSDPKTDPSYYLNQAFLDEVLYPSEWKATTIRPQLQDAEEWWAEHKEHYVAACGKPRMTSSNLPVGLVQSAALCMIWVSNSPVTSKRRIDGSRFKLNPDAEDCMAYEDHSVLMCPSTLTQEQADKKEGALTQFTQKTTQVTGATDAARMLVLALAGLLGAVFFFWKVLTKKKPLSQSRTHAAGTRDKSNASDNAQAPEPSSLKK
jgi:hypothetical protein